MSLSSSRRDPEGPVVEVSLCLASQGDRAARGREGSAGSFRPNEAESRSARDHMAPTAAALPDDDR